MFSDNEHQYTKLIEVISQLDYYNKHISIADLGQVVRAIENIISNFQNPTPVLVENLRKHWWVLEEIYAVLLDEKRNSLNEDEISLIQKAKISMLEIISQK